MVMCKWHRWLIEKIGKHLWLKESIFNEEWEKEWRTDEDRDLYIN